MDTVDVIGCLRTIGTNRRWRVGREYSHVVFLLGRAKNYENIKRFFSRILNVFDDAQAVKLRKILGVENGQNLSLIGILQFSA